MNKSISAKYLLKMPTIKPFLLGVLFSRIMPKPQAGVTPEHFYCYTFFKSSKYVYKSDFDLKKYATELLKQYNDASGLENWEIKSVSESKIELRFYIKNDLNVDSAAFYNLIYQKLLHEQWLAGDDLNEKKKAFVRGYMETRGSIDTTAKYIAQDYFYNNIIELKRVLILTNIIGLPIGYANFNPRNMQPQYVSGISKRNAQFRINLFFYAKEIGFINKYKAQVFENAYHEVKKDLYEKNGVIYFVLQVPEINDEVTFIKYLQFFTNNIYNKKLTKSNIELYRKKLGFKDQTKRTISNNRDQSIIDIFRNVSEDKCAICGTTKTFETNNDKEYFEIHHVIPFHNGIKYDNIANLVKLCPTCHSLLKKNRASKEEQIKAIKGILTNNVLVHQYASAALGFEDIDKLSEIIQTMLG